MIVKILNVDKTEYVDGATFNVVRYGRKNRSCSFDMTSMASSWLPSVGQDLKIYNDDLELLFGGTIKSLKISQYEKGNSNTSRVLSSIYSDGYKNIAERRTVSIGYDKVYAGAIMRDMLNKGLNSPIANEGLSTEGTIDDGVYLKHYYKSVVSMKDVFDELAEASGFEWDIDDSKKLIFTAESSVPLSSHELTSTGSFKDWYDVTFTYDLDQYRNKQFVVGGVDEEGNRIVVSVESTSQRAARISVEGGSSFTSGVYGDVIIDDNIKTEADALVVAENALKQHGLAGGLTFRSETVDWLPSTKLPVKIPKYGINDLTYYLIEEVELNQETPTKLVATVSCILKDPDDFGSQKSYDDVKFMEDLVRIAKNVQEGIAGESGGLNGSISMRDYSTYSSSELTVTSVESVLLTLTVDVEIKSDLKVFFSCSGGSTGAVNVTLKTYVGGVVRDYQPAQDHSSGDALLTYIDTIEDQAGSTTPVVVEIKGVTDGLNFVIPAKFATLNVLEIPLISGISLLDVEFLTLTVISIEQINEAWGNPLVEFIEVELYRSESDLTSQDREWCDANATLVYNGTGESNEDTGLTPDTLYYYKIFVEYDQGFSNGVTKSARTSAQTFDVSVLDSLEHDSDAVAVGGNDSKASIAMIDSTHFMLSYSGADADGFLKVFSIDGSYEITQVSSLEHETGQLLGSSLVKIDSTHFMLAYGGTSMIKTFSIDGSYNISQIDSLNHDIANLGENSLIMIDSTHFILACSGHVKTFSIDGSYDNITQIDELALTASSNSMVKIDSTHYMLAHGGADSDGYITILSIDGSYDNITVVSSLEHDTSNGTYNSLVMIDSTHFILAYRGSGGSNTYCNLKTFSIDESYNITQIDLLETGVNGIFHSLVMIDSTHFMLAYNGFAAHSIIKIYSIDGSYDTITEVDSLDHDSEYGAFYDLIKIDSVHYMLAYTNTSETDAWIKTLKVI